MSAPATTYFFNAALTAFNSLKPPRCNTMYTMGMKINVTSVDELKPPIRARAKGAIDSPPSPRASAMGTRPTTVVNVVIKIGRKRRRADSKMAS